MALSVSQDTPLAAQWAAGRTKRIVDGPVEVHLLQLGRGENTNGAEARKIIQAQKEKPVELFGGYGLPWTDVLQLNRTLQKSKL
jgi:acyl-CoA dehydrogenase